MQLQLFENSRSLADHAAGEMIRLIESKPNAVICLPSGNSPKETCAAFVRKIREEGIDTRSVFFIGLDEWAGIDLGQRGSCRFDFMERVFGPLEIPASQYHLFDGMAEDLNEECSKMEETIHARGGIDLMIVGIGMNGHIGFNEPGTPFDLHSHVAVLDAVTSTVGQQYFDAPQTLKKGITLGPSNLMEAKAVILLAQGTKKAAVIRKTMQGEVSPDFPASLLQLHGNSHVFIDREAATELQ